MPTGMYPRQKRPKTIEQINEVFWSKVDKNTCLGDICGCHKGIGHCWPWIAGKFPSGYGAFGVTIDGRLNNFRAHRFAYESENGLLLPGICVCHSCDVKRCCNNSHLWPGTGDDNMKDAAEKGIMMKAAEIRRPRSIESFARGVQIKNAKLTEEMVVQIRALHGHSPATELAKMFNTSESNIYRVWNRELWKHI